VTRTLYCAMLIAFSLGSTAVCAAPRDSHDSAPYPVVKAAIAKVYRETGSSRKPGNTRGTYDLDNCQGGSDFVGDHNDLAKLSRIRIYADIANEATIWETDLAALGYPAYLWQPWVKHYENSAVNLLKRVPPAQFYEAWQRSSPPFERLQSRLNKYWRAHRNLARIVNVGGCGAGEQTWKLVTQPRAAQVLIIPSFFYQLCQVERINPHDTSRCAHWREVIDGTITEVSGAYYYRVRWRDGRLRLGKLSFDEIRGDTLTLRPR